jgi:charged multivesicular body protein 4
LQLFILLKMGAGSSVRRPAAPTKAAMAAIAINDETIVNISKKEDQLQRKIGAEFANAKKFHAAGKKREARQCIQKKKMYEQQLTTLGTSKMNLENLKSTIMSLNDYLMANDVLIKTIGGVDKVEELMDGLVEVHTDAREIDNAMNRQLGGIDADDDELLAEYAKLDRLMEEKRAADLSKVDLPRGHTTRSRSA